MNCPKYVQETGGKGIQVITRYVIPLPLFLCRQSFLKLLLAPHLAHQPYDFARCSIFAQASFNPIVRLNTSLPKQGCQTAAAIARHAPLAVCCVRKGNHRMARNLAIKLPLAEHKLAVAAGEELVGNIRSGGKAFNRPRNAWRSSAMSAPASPRNSSRNRSFSSVRMPTGRRPWLPISICW